MANKDDFLIELAFGDRNDPEALRQLESDPGSAKELKLYQEMRDGLKQLRDIPDMQMSGERLRDAILREGLRPVHEPAPTSFRWLWFAAPVAAAALFAFFAMRPTSLEVKPSIAQVDPNTRVAIVQNPKDEPAEDFTMDLDKTMKVFGSQAVAESEPEPVRPSAKLATTEPKVIRPKRKTSGLRLAVRFGSSGRRSVSMSTAPAPAGTGGRSSAPDAVTMAAALPTPPPSVVEIQEDPLRPSGTRAVEVQSASESVIGG